MAPLRQAQQRNGVPEELVKDVKIELYREGKKTGEAFVKDNYQRLCSVGIGDVPADEIRVIPRNRPMERNRLSFMKSVCMQNNIFYL